MKTQKTNRLQNYELTKLHGLLNAMEVKTDFEYLSFSRIYTGQQINYPTNEKEADIFIKDRVRILLEQDMKSLIVQAKNILFTDLDILA